MQAHETFPPTRADALIRLAAFVPRAGRDYAENRNADPGPGARPGVSMLSPYLRHRLITEEEVVAAVVAHHGPVGAEKFVQEVFWRTYWKGWLEMRPTVWERFLSERDAAQARAGRSRALAAAQAGMTGIEGFDDWARELMETGYLHNHARMWFASIWIFTLRLPWTLGADFFLRHLIDADPASNTLSWRWVAGLQTAGKTYLATADNIERWTNGRFRPNGLAKTAVPLSEAPVLEPVPLETPAEPDPGAPFLLLVTPEDLHPESVIAPRQNMDGALVLTSTGNGGDRSRAFVAAAAEDAAARVATQFACPVQMIETLDPGVMHTAAQNARVGRIVTPYAPTGPIAQSLHSAADALKHEGVEIVRVQRDWDRRAWPHAKKGFFAFKERIPALLAEKPR